MGSESLLPLACQEQKYVSIGRWGEWRACDKPAKHTTVATSSGKNFKSGDTIHVCGVHKRKHEQRIAKDAERKRKNEESEGARVAATDRRRRLGAGRVAYHDYPISAYTGGLELTAEEVDRLLAELGR